MSDEWSASGMVGSRAIEPEAEPDIPEGPVIVRSYPGRTQADAAVIFAEDAVFMAGHGYRPISQSWADGRPGMARVVTLGVAGMMIRPKGFLTVTYQRLDADADMKECPDCAEMVKTRAHVCHWCGYRFPV